MLEEIKRKHEYGRDLLTNDEVAYLISENEQLKLKLKAAENYGVLQNELRKGEANARNHNSNIRSRSGNSNYQHRKGS